MRGSCKLTKQTADRILKADDFQKNGDPYKDALEQWDIEELIEWAACVIKKERKQDDV